MSWSIFDRLWWRYENWFERNQITVWNELLLVKSMLGTYRKGLCVDIGGGSGWFSSRLGCESVVDPSRAMLRLAVYRGLIGIQGVAESLPLSDNSIEVLLYIVSLCFIEDIETALKEAKRILEPGRGRLIACIIPRDSPWGETYQREKLSGNPFYQNVKLYTIKEIETFLEDTGLNPTPPMGTLSYHPWDPPRIEEPQEYRKIHGFACIEAKKPF